MKQYLTNSHFHYDLFKDEKTIAIIDYNAIGMSVTNDIENVCNYIEQAEKIDLTEYNIIYRDFDNMWDAVKYRGKDKYVNFILLQERDFETAKRKLLNLNK